jgi:hypothetical protein
VTVPFPLPLAPESMLIQGKLLVAVQLQPVDAVTITLPDSIAEPCDWLVGEIANVQPGIGVSATVSVTPASRWMDPESAVKVTE